MTANMVTAACRHLFVRAETSMGQTPLHFAMKNANVELVLCIFGVIQQSLPAWTAGSNKLNAQDLINELHNCADFQGMRPIDLLAFRIDDD